MVQTSSTGTNQMLIIALPFGMMVIIYFYTMVKLAKRLHMLFTAANNKLFMFGKIFYSSMVLQCLIRIIACLIIAICLSFPQKFKGYTVSQIFNNLSIVPVCFLWISFILLMWQYQILHTLGHIRVSSQRYRKEVPLSHTKKAYLFLIGVLFMLAIMQIAIVVLYNLNKFDVKDYYLYYTVIDIVLCICLAAQVVQNNVKYSGAPFRSESYNEPIRHFYKVCAIWGFSRLLNGGWNIFYGEKYDEFSNSFFNVSSTTYTDTYIAIIIFVSLLILLITEILPFLFMTIPISLHIFKLNHADQHSSSNEINQIQKSAIRIENYSIDNTSIIEKQDPLINANINRHGGNLSQQASIVSSSIVNISSHNTSLEKVNKGQDLSISCVVTSLNEPLLQKQPNLALSEVIQSNQNQDTAIVNEPSKRRQREKRQKKHKTDQNQDGKSELLMNKNNSTNSSNVETSMQQINQNQSQTKINQTQQQHQQQQFTNINVNANKNYNQCIEPEYLIKQLDSNQYKTEDVLKTDVKHTLGNVSKIMISFQKKEMWFVKREIRFQISNLIKEQIQRDFDFLQQKNYIFLPQMLNLNMEQNNYIYMFSEYIENSLHEVISNETKYNKLTTVQKCNILLQVSEILQAMHAQKIYHGHLTPYNIFVSKDMKVVKISDFLFNALKKLASIVTSYSNKNMYSSPEQLQNAKTFVSPSTAMNDIYGLAMIAYELFHSKNPFCNLSIEEIKQKVCVEMARPMIQSHVPEDIAKLIRCCWQQEAQNRPQIVQIIETFQSIIKKAH